MIKWVLDWHQARQFQDEVRQHCGNIWAIKMPKSYPECRVTRSGIAHIALTDDELMVETLRQDGGEVRLMP
jgi:hypothetical protein